KDSLSERPAHHAVCAEISFLVVMQNNSISAAPVFFGSYVNACGSRTLRLRNFTSRLTVTSRHASGHFGTATAGFPRLSKNCWFSRTEQICWYRKKPVRESVKLRRAFHGLV